MGYWIMNNELLTSTVSVYIVLPVSTVVVSKPTHPARELIHSLYLESKIGSDIYFYINSIKAIESRNWMEWTSLR